MPGNRTGDPKGIPSPGAGRPPYLRWANVVAGAMDAPTDLRTLEAWAHHVGTSVGALKNLCSRVGLSARASLLLARFLRALVQAHRFGGRPDDFVDVFDPRTLRKLLSAAGLSGTALSEIDQFLRSQRFVTEPRAIDALIQRLRSGRT